MNKEDVCLFAAVVVYLALLVAAFYVGWPRSEPCGRTDVAPARSHVVLVRDEDGAA